MKHAIMLDVPENAAIKPLEDALIAFGESLNDGLFTAVFADGLGHEESYNGFLLMVDDSLIAARPLVMITVSEGEFVLLVKDGVKIKASYVNRSLPPYEPMRVSVYSRAENGGVLCQ